MLNIKRILNASKYSVQGLRAAWNEEKAFRDDLVVCAICLGLTFSFANSYEQVFISILSLVLLLVTELLNTGIESLADKVSPEFCEFCKVAKDVGSAAVMLVLVYIFFFHLYLILN